jgi:hypothetical protein
MYEKESRRRIAIKHEDDLHNVLASMYAGFQQCGCTDCSVRSAREACERNSAYKSPSLEEWAEYLGMKAESSEWRAREAKREEQAREVQEKMKREKERPERIRKEEERKRAAAAKEESDGFNC